MRRVAHSADLSVSATLTTAFGNSEPAAGGLIPPRKSIEEANHDTPAPTVERTAFKLQFSDSASGLEPRSRFIFCMPTGLPKGCHCIPDGVRVCAAARTLSLVFPARGACSQVRYDQHLG
jgi:hypothetical protein